jgi:phenylacetic acid degradation operon negative regulatory protein
VRLVLGAASAGRGDRDRSSLTSASATRLDLRPLTARSVILSLLLGIHRPSLPVRVLVRTAELFGISEGTTRVALSRLASDGDVVAHDGAYGLSPRLLSRQHRQDEGLRPAVRPWRGGWEVAVLRPGAHGSNQRAAARAELADLRLAELRAGVWTRPNNLVRPWPERLQGILWCFEAKSAYESATSAELVSSLWNLPAWADTAEALLESLAANTDPAQRFVLAAAVIRHLRDDPVLPPALLPPRWPGRRLRSSYESYGRELGELMRREHERYDGRIRSDPAG